MSKADRDRKKVKLAFCSCGCGGWVSIADLPYAESDRDTRNEFGKLAKSGCRIDVMTFGEYVFNDYPAGCQRLENQAKQKAKQMKLF